MHELINFTGGRKAYNSDWRSLQRQLNMLKNYLFKGYAGGFVVAGCEVENVDDISAGLVHLNGKLIEFEGATNVTFPCYIYQLTDEEFSSRLYTIDNINKNALKKTRAGITNVEPVGVDYVTVLADGTRRDLQDVQTDLVSVTPAWQNVTLINGWQQLGGIFAKANSQWIPQYRKNKLGMVSIRGGVYTGSPETATSWTFGVLPVGYRPTKELYFPLMGSGLGDYSAVYAERGLIIKIDGSLIISNSGGQPEAVFEFRLDIPPFYVD